MNQDVEEILWSYIFENHLPRNTEFEYDNDVDLFDKGIIDSAGLISFIIYIEQKFNLTIPDEDLIPEYFSSIASIAAYIRKRIKKLLFEAPSRGVKNGINKKMHSMGS